MRQCLEMSGNTVPLHICPNHPVLPNEPVPLDSQYVLFSCTPYYWFSDCLYALIFRGVFVLLLPGIQECKLTEEFLYIATSGVLYFKKVFYSFFITKSTQPQSCSNFDNSEANSRSITTPIPHHPKLFNRTLKMTTSKNFSIKEKIKFKV